MDVCMDLESNKPEWLLYTLSKKKKNTSWNSYGGSKPPHPSRLWFSRRKMLDLGGLWEACGRPTQTRYTRTPCSYIILTSILPRSLKEIQQGERIRRLRCPIIMHLFLAPGHEMFIAIRVLAFLLKNWAQDCIEWVYRVARICLRMPAKYPPTTNEACSPGPRML